MALLVRAAGLLLLLGAPLWCDALFFSAPSSPSNWDFVAVFGLMMLAVLAIALVTRAKPFLRVVLYVSLLERMAATGAFVYLVFNVYHGGADVWGYVRKGTALAGQFYSHGEWSLLYPIWSNNFVLMATRDLFLLFWPSMILGMVGFSLLAFAGQYLAYRGYEIAYPNADRKLGAVVILLMPSVVFWSAAVGKDSLMMFFLGLVLYAFARINRERAPKAVALLILGVAGTFLVRPHVGVMVAVAVVLPYVLVKPRNGITGIATKVVLLPILFLIVFYLAVGGANFVNVREASQLEPMLTKVVKANQDAASSGFGPTSVAMRIVGAPLMFFRPLPWEISSAQSAIAGL